MIKTKEEMLSEFKKEMRGGKGTVEIQHIFNKDEFKGKTSLIAHVTLNPGCSIGLHEHSNEEEIYYITKGKMLVTDDGISREVVTGDAIITGGGKSHSIENNTDEIAELVAIVLLY